MKTVVAVESPEPTEQQLRKLWSAYVDYTEKYGDDEKARALRENYFRLYQSYKRNERWKKAFSTRA